MYAKLVYTIGGKVYTMTTLEIKRAARSLKKEGYSLRKIAAIFGVHHSTVSYWLRTVDKAPKSAPQEITNPKAYLVENNLVEEYSYILGIYLGDGCLDKLKRCYRLRIFCDAQQETAQNKIIKALGKIFPNNKISKVNKALTETCTVVYAHHKNLNLLFPQHGVGKKYKRRIILHKWQEQILVPEQFIAGLIDSDGCRYRCKTNKRLFYNFNQKSKDIFELFLTKAKIIGLQPTWHLSKTKSKYNQYIANFYKKADVDTLENICGPK